MASRSKDADGRHWNRWRMIPWGISTLVLVFALLAMQFVDGMDWDETDFIVMAILLFGGCGVLELAARMTGNVAYRVAVGIVVVATFLLIWINLAVGIIGSEDNPANLMYSGVLSIAIIGACIARFQPMGMTRALVATAIAQMFVAATTLFYGLGSTGENWPQVIYILNGFFAAVWLGSAWLFSRAARGV